MSKAEELANELARLSDRGPLDADGIKDTLEEYGRLVQEEAAKKADVRESVAASAILENACPNSMYVAKSIAAAIREMPLP